MSGKHTPGPWTVAAYYECQTLVRAGDPKTGRRVAITWCSTPKSSDKEVYLNSIRVNEANARLIAAAPDLLEAAKGILTAPDVDDWDTPATRALRAAIAKAEGRA